MEERRIPKRLALACALLLGAATSPPALAQPEPATGSSYQLAQLERRPGELLVSPGYLTLVDFPAPVEAVSSGRAALVRVEVQGSRVLLSAAAGQGRTDLVVVSGGRTAMFVVAVDAKGQGPRRYTVADAPPPVQAARPPTPRPAPPFAAKPAPPPRAAPAPKPVQPAPAPKPAATPSATPTPAPRPPSPLASRPVAAQPMAPDGLSFEASAERVGGELVLRYSLTNTGPRPALVDPALLEVLGGPRRVPFALARTPDPATRFLAPGAVERGMVVLEGPVAGRLVLRWPVVETGPARRATLEVTLDATTPRP